MIWPLPLGYSLLAAGCIDVEEPQDESIAMSEASDDDATASDSAGESTGDGLALEPLSPLAAEPDVAAGLPCVQTNDCQDVCVCWEGSCIPDGFGPPPPVDVCSLPPQRSCDSASDCQSGCMCSGGVCQPNGFSPPNPYCHMPPPDSYEYDDTWQSWSAYMGSPQRHNLHTANDNDWIAVYFPAAGNARFWTHGLTLGADTRIEVYAYDGVTIGALLGSNDDVGGWWWIADSKGSRVDLAATANTAYLVRVINESPASIYTDSHEFPSYTLEIAYI